MASGETKEQSGDKIAANDANPDSPIQGHPEIISERREAPKATRRLPMRRKHDLFDWLTLSVFTLTFLAASWAAIESKRLADLTQVAITDAKTAAETQEQLTRTAIENSRTSSEQQSNDTRESLRLAKQAAVANQRAWVGPDDAKFDGAPTVDHPIDYVIAYHNTGKEPAQGFQYDLDSFTATEREDLKGVTAVRINSDMRKCVSKQAIVGAQVVFPTVGFSAYNLRGTVSGDLVSEQVISGKKAIVIEGCFVYTTAEEIRHSTFCYFFKTGKTKPEQLNICANGNYAD
jgi:hypothetical protein